MELKEQITYALKDSIIESLTTILSLMPNVKEIELREAIQEEGNIAASIGFVGKIEGSFIIKISDIAARKILSKLFNNEFEGQTQDFYDCVAEIINIIAGGIKTKMEQIGYSFITNIPSVIRGEQSLNITASSKANIIAMSVDCADFNLKFIMFYMLNQQAEEMKYANLKKQNPQDAEKAIKNFIDQK